MLQRTVRPSLHPMLAAACALWLIASGGAADAASTVRFSLERAIDGAAAPFIAADAKGLYRTEGLDVVIDAAQSSQDAIARVAKGEIDIALADVNVLIRTRDGDGAAPIKAVFTFFNKASYSIVARKSRGIGAVADLNGKRIALVETDPAARLWPAIAKLNGVKLDGVKSEKISAAVREPLLSAGQVDAVTGSSYLSALNLRDRGVPASDLAVLKFSDFGQQVYGHVLIVNPDFAQTNPDDVRAFVRGTVAGIKFAIRDPAKAIDDVTARMSGASRELELERLRTMLRDCVLTEDVKRDGLGGMTLERFNAGIEQIAQDFEFRKRPVLGDIFDDRFLPANSGRKIF